MFDTEFEISAGDDASFKLKGGYYVYSRGSSVHFVKQLRCTGLTISQTCYMEGTILKHGFVKNEELKDFGIKNISPLVNTLRNAGAPLASMVIRGKTHWFYANKPDAVLALVPKAKPKPPRGVRAQKDEKNRTIRYN